MEFLIPDQCVLTCIIFHRKFLSLSHNSFCRRLTIITFFMLPFFLFAFFSTHYSIQVMYHTQCTIDGAIKEVQSFKEAIFGFRHRDQKMVFCLENCSDLLLEKFVLVIEKQIQAEGQEFAKNLRSCHQNNLFDSVQNNF